MVNYFEFYQIDEGFFIDEANLKKLYFQKSREFHPDFYQGNDTEYETALEQSSINNLAYKSLKKFNSRWEYILKLHGVLEESQNKLSPSFLMEMMDINEVIMDLKLDFDQDKLNSVSVEVEELMKSFESKIQSEAKKYDSELPESAERLEILNNCKEIYLKQKYVLRIKESLNTFAPL
ncbi:MAG: iron-sulfur cluster co-chaperone HscB C-terminal domain-containing protein [Bacteroidia bacterium]